MNGRIKKYVAAATLVVSVGGGGALIASNASSMIASTADAGQPGGIIVPGKPCGGLTNPCRLK